MKMLNKKQELALKNLEKAFKKCKDAKINFCGMDSSIYYASEKAIKKRDKNKDYRGGDSGYNEVAETVYGKDSDDYTCGLVETHNSYLDSGGW